MNIQVEEIEIITRAKVKTVRGFKTIEARNTVLLSHAEIAMQMLGREAAQKALELKARAWRVKQHTDLAHGEAEVYHE